MQSPIGNDGATLNASSGQNSLPRIGITPEELKDGALVLPMEYVRGVQRAGGIAVVLPPWDTDVALLLAGVDGIILAGGADVDPALYGSAGHPAVYDVDEGRDAGEIEIIRYAIAHNLPLLGICRGAQLLNVALGGTLIEHLPDYVGEQVRHRASPPGVAYHSVRLASDSRLAQIVGEVDPRIASWHHQAIRKVAPDLVAVAWAADGTVEAVEMPSHAWMVAVQWHPELTAADDPAQQRIFDALVQAARTQARTIVARAGTQA